MPDDALWRLVREQEVRLRDAEARIQALQLACLPLTRTWWHRILWLFGR